jgi:hypothetical protein
VNGRPQENSDPCQPFSEDDNFLKRNHADSISKVNGMEDLRLLRWLQKFCNLHESHGQNALSSVDAKRSSF